MLVKYHSITQKQMDIYQYASGSNFIIGGQISGQDPALMMVYPVGNYIRASEIKPFFQLR